jgi:hypothetical protein
MVDDLKENGVVVVLNAECTLHVPVPGTVHSNTGYMNVTLQVNFK